MELDEPEHPWRRKFAVSALTGDTRPDTALCWVWLLIHFGRIMGVIVQLLLKCMAEGEMIAALLPLAAHWLCGLG